MFTHCYFDMFDNCVAMDQAGVQLTITHRSDDVVLGGQYHLPESLNPLGMSAEQLFPYAVRTTGGCPNGSCPF